MTPSTETTDQLLAWHPGPSEAASTNILSALLLGARQAWNSKLLIGYLWLFYFLIVEGAGNTLLGWLGGSTTVPLTGQTGAGSLFAVQPIDSGYLVIILNSIARPLWSPSAYFVLFFGVISGGAIAYVHAPRPASVLAQISANCGVYLGRFVRLLVIAAAIFWFFTMLYSNLSHPDVTGLSGRVFEAVFQTIIVFWAVVIDYARVRTVARDSRSMFMETLRSFHFVIRNLVRTLPLEFLLVILTVALGAVVHAGATAIGSLLPSNEVAYVADQVYVIALLWVRLTAWGAMMAIYKGATLERLTGPQT